MSKFYVFPENTKKQTQRLKNPATQMVPTIFANFCFTFIFINFCSDEQHRVYTGANS